MERYRSIGWPDHMSDTSKVRSLSVGEGIISGVDIEGIVYHSDNGIHLEEEKDSGSYIEYTILYKNYDSSFKCAETEIFTNKREAIDRCAELLEMVMEEVESDIGYKIKELQEKINDARDYINEGEWKNE